MTSGVHTTPAQLQKPFVHEQDFLTSNSLFSKAKPRLHARLSTAKCIKMSATAIFTHINQGLTVHLNHSLLFYKKVVCIDKSNMLLMLLASSSKQTTERWGQWLPLFKTITFELQI